MSPEIVTAPPDVAPLRLKVFIAEDNLDAVDSLRRLLELEGCDVVGTATTEAAALSWLLHNPGGWNLAILDLLLEEGSGFNVLRQFVKAKRSGAVVLYSAYMSEMIRAKASDFGASAAFSKLEGPLLARYARNLRELLAHLPPSRAEDSGE